MTESDKRTRRAAADENWRRSQQGLSHLFDAITPWLMELGNWIFGALIAFNLLILGVVLTIGPVDVAVKIATAAFAAALPPNVVGFVLLRVADDMRKNRIRESAAQAFQDAGFQVEDAPDPKVLEKQLGQRTLKYTYSLMTLTLLLTLIGLFAALWHSAWWIAVVFLATLVLSQVVMMAALSGVGGNRRWRAARPAEAEPPKPG